MHPLRLTVLLLALLCASSVPAMAGPADAPDHYRNLASRAAVAQYENAKRTALNLDVPDVPTGVQAAVDTATGVAGELTSADVAGAVEAALGGLGDPVAVATGAAADAQDTLTDATGGIVPSFDPARAAFHWTNLAMRMVQNARR